MKNLLRKLTVFVLILTLSLVTAVSFAQEDSESDMADMEEGTFVTLEELTANSLDYYGMQVTIEGVVGELVNAKAFSVGEDVTIDNDLVLVVSNQAEAFGVWLVNEERVRVTGVVFPSRQAVEAGAQTNFGEAVNELVDTTNDIFTGRDVLNEETDPRQYDNVPVMVEYVYDGYLPEGFNNYTIIVVDDLDNILQIAEEPGDPIHPAGE